LSGGARRAERYVAADISAHPWGARERIAAARLLPGDDADVATRPLVNFDLAFCFGCFHRPDRRVH
jgi:hypothetical protein